MKFGKIKVFIALCSAPSYGRWIDLTSNYEKIESTLNNIQKSNQNDDLAVMDVFSDFGFDTTFFPSIESCKTFARQWNLLDDDERFNIVAGVDSCVVDKYRFKDLSSLIIDLGVIEATNDEALGRWLIEEGELLCIPEHIEPYFDFEEYGRDFRFNVGGNYSTKYGCFVYLNR